jgi:hypothetical protein
MLRFSLS